MTLTNAQGGIHAIRFRLANMSATAWLSRIYFRYRADRGSARYRNRIVHHNYGNHELAVSLEDPVADGWYDHDWPMMPELTCLCESRLGRGARVFDVGAHQGIVALMLSRLVGPAGQVVAVEAERHNYEVARRNRHLNDAPNLELLHAAGGATDGSLYFRGGFNGNVTRRGRVGLARVPAVSIDGLSKRYGVPDVVFIDVEGYELEVLRGAARTLAGGRTDFFVEVHVGRGLESLGGSARAVLEQFDPDRFRRLVSPAGGESDDYSFGDLDDRTELLGKRFFLIAFAPRSGVSRSG
jgi:FkbM family methyltransferase